MVDQVHIVGLMIAMALALITVSTISLVRRDRARHGPTYRRLCRALRIPVSDRRLLRRIARSIDVPCAASLLVSRGCFDAAAKRQGREVSRRLAAVRGRVFE